MKLYSVVPDGAIGFQTLNQAALNNVEMKMQMAVGHGTHEFGLVRRPGNIDFHRLGRHDLTEVPRSVAQTAAFSAFAGFGFGSNGLAWGTPGIAAVYWISTGVYFVAVNGLASFWGKVTPLVASGVVALEPQVRAVSPANSALGTGLQVSLFVLSGGAFVATDMAFTIELYGTP